MAAYASVVDVADNKTADQLLYGFYPVEEGAWRWTGKRFGIMLRNPSAEGAAGAVLRMHFYVPDSQIKALGRVTLYTSLDCAELPPQVLSTGGSHELQEVVPPSELKTNLLPIYFRFDKAAPPTSREVRELGATVTSFGLYTN